MIGAFRSVFCKSKVRWSIVTKIVTCLSVLLMLSIGRLKGAGGCRQRLSGVCSLRNYIA